MKKEPDAVGAEVIPCSRTIWCYRKGINRGAYSLQRTGILRVKFRDGDAVEVPLFGSIGRSPSVNTFKRSTDIPLYLRKYVEKAIRLKKKKTKRQSEEAPRTRRNADENKEKRKGGAPTRPSDVYETEVEA